MCAPGGHQHVRVHAHYEGHIFQREDPGLPQPQVPQASQLQHVLLQLSFSHYRPPLGLQNLASARSLLKLQ